MKKQGNFLLLRRRKECAAEFKTLADYVIPRNQYEKAVKRSFGYLLIYVKTITQDNCRQRTNVLPSEGGFDQVGFQGNNGSRASKISKAAKSFACPDSSSYARTQATWMTCFLETILGTMGKLSDTFSCKRNAWLLKNN